jgi:hypothetical protein
MSALAGVIAVLLVGAASAPAEPAWLPGEHGGADVRLTIENWGGDVDLSGARQAYAHLGANGPTTHITVRITPPPGGMHGYSGRLRAPDAFGGELTLYCGDEYRRIEQPVFCGFDVPISSGLNRLTFDVQSASWEGRVEQTGTVFGGRVDQVSLLEARSPGGSWTVVPARGILRLPGAQNAAVRFRIMNIGDLPFRVPDSCQPDGIVWPGQQLLCGVYSSGSGPVLARAFRIPVQLVDPVGGGASYSITGTVVPGSGHDRNVVNRGS